MWDLCRLIWWALVRRFRSRAALEAENLVLRHQINVLRRTASTRPRFGNIDRSIFISVYRFFPNVRDALAIVQPATVIRWQDQPQVRKPVDCSRRRAKECSRRCSRSWRVLWRRSRPRAGAGTRSTRAVTCGKRLVVIVGPRRALAIAVKASDAPPSMNKACQKGRQLTPERTLGRFWP